ncbi:MAG: triose-phosphate isomerase [Candidatus Dormibacteria bacterium]
MSRTPLVAGNWKMNKTVPESIVLAGEIARGIGASAHNPEVVLLPPFTSLWAVSTAIGDSPIGLGAQDIYWERAGAFTGEVSPAMVSGWCRYALIGHSERRALFGENEESVNRKLHAAVREGLRPIVAVGETLAERDGGHMIEVLSRQVPGGIYGLDEHAALELVVAYEPVWAIGTGRTATPEQAEKACALIRGLVGETLGSAVAEAVRILYGGSVNAGNAATLMALPSIDGALVGGASLVATDFLAIVAAAARPVA